VTDPTRADRAHSACRHTGGIPGDPGFASKFFAPMTRSRCQPCDLVEFTMLIAAGGAPRKALVMPLEIRCRSAARRFPFRLIARGTESSNPLPSSGESTTNSRMRTQASPSSCIGGNCVASAGLHRKTPIAPMPKRRCGGPVANVRLAARSKSEGRSGNDEGE
jgi:hypothetical protein